MQELAPVLITGGSGLIGSAITEALTHDRIPVRWYSRQKLQPSSGVQVFAWNPANGSADAAALTGVETIIHLAGAGIADERWSPARKALIVNSRVQAADTMFELLRTHPHQVKTIVAASAVGYYGDRGEQLVDEAAAPGRGFLSDSCVAWERALSRFSELGIRIVILRVGFVLSRQGGALPVMRKPVVWLLGTPLGSGKQYISWIDLDDLVGLFRFAMDHHQLRGTYNAVAPAPVTNRQLVSTIGKVLHRPVWPIPVPGFLLQLVLGEKAVLVTGGQRVSADKIQRAGYHFHFPALEASLRHQLL